MADKTIHPFGEADYPLEADVKKDVDYAFGRKTGELEAGGAAGLPRTGQTTSYVDYDDGYYEAGLPAGAGVRFTDNLDGTITDNVTGLMWQQAGNGFQGTWANAIAYAEALELGGETDWRLPNIKELQSIVNYGRVGSAADDPPFENTQSGSYWSSTTRAEDTDYAWVADFFDGVVAMEYKTSDSQFARCVRGGQLNT